MLCHPFELGRHLIYSMRRHLEDGLFLSYPLTGNFLCQRWRRSHRLSAAPFLCPQRGAASFLACLIGSRTPHCLSLAARAAISRSMVAARLLLRSRGSASCPSCSIIL